MISAKLSALLGTPNPYSSFPGSLLDRTLATSSKRAFPDSQVPPAGRFEFLPDLRIPVAVSLKLFRPEAASRGRHPEKVTVMLMPEAAVDEDDGAMACQSEIRTARKCAIMQSETKA